MPFSSFIYTMAAQVSTVLLALIACGVDNDVRFMGQTQAERVAEDVFDNLFTTCMDLTFDKLDDHFKTYSELTVASARTNLFSSRYAQERKGLCAIDTG